MTYRNRMLAIISLFFLEHLHSTGSKSIANIQSNNSELFLVFVLSLIFSPLLSLKLKFAEKRMVCHLVFFLAV